MSPRVLEVRLGEHNIFEDDREEDATEVYHVKSYTVHPNYTKQGMGMLHNDIAILFLDHRVRIKIGKSATESRFGEYFDCHIYFVVQAKLNDRISPVCLPDPSADPSLKDLSTPDGLAGQRAWVTGWGLIDFNTAEMAETLLEAEVRVNPLKECQSAYKKRSSSNDINEVHLCARGDENQDACQVSRFGLIVWGMISPTI